MMMYPYYGYGFGPSFGIVGGVVHAITVVFVVIVVLFILRRVLGGQGVHHWEDRWTSQSGLSILNERYAKGEITKEEYEERKKTLLGG